jgi:predicted RNase H-like HicB family nuclease
MLTAIFESTEEGRFYATIRELPEVQTEGDTLQEAEENLTDALCLVLIDKLQELEQKLQAWLGLELHTQKLCNHLAKKLPRAEGQYTVNIQNLTGPLFSKSETILADIRHTDF